MPRLEQLSEVQRKTLLTHPALLNDTVPWTAPRKPVAQSTVALVTTAGIHRRGDEPFRGGDLSYRVFPTDTPARDLVMSHASIGSTAPGSCATSTFRCRWRRCSRRTSSEAVPTFAPRSCRRHCSAPGPAE